MILSDAFVDQYRNKKVNWGYNGLGFIVFKKSYARAKEDGSTETWVDTLKRTIEGAQKVGADYTREEAERLFDYMFHFKCSLAGRMLWQLGTETVERFGGNSLLNCFATNIEKIEDFCFLFNNLMMGGGVGFSIKRENMMQLPKIMKGVVVTCKDTNDADFIVPDSREGWIELLRKTLEAYMVKGKSFSYSTVLVRSAGTPIKSFGGVASGPQILKDGIEGIANIMKLRCGKKLRSIDVLDICNLISTVVINGNVRRSAAIAIGDPDDYLFLRAKRWDLGKIPSWRAMSNNSIFCDDFSYLSEEYWKGFMGNGEPYGLINIPLGQKHGRLRDGVRDPDICLVNPCAEILLPDKGACDLGEVFLNNIESKEELIDCATLVYKTLKAISGMRFVEEETTEIMNLTRRIGIGVTGICQSEEKLEWLDGCYQAVREFDEKYSESKGWPKSIKISTLKPSGSLSLLGGATPGVHPAFDKFYIRRVRMSSNDNLVKICRDIGYNVVYEQNYDGSENHNTVVIEFPCTSGNGAILAKDMSALDQMELVKKMQTIWSDQSVSVTIYYKPEEVEEIKEWLKKNYNNSVKSISFLLHKEHGFQQAPYESIDEDTYQKLCKKIDLEKLNKYVVGSGGELLDGVECEGGNCPLR